MKDALTSSSLYTTIDDMLMHAYYLNEKSPKKCHELNEVVASLRQCLEEDVMPAVRTRGNRPLHACGTRFVSHKVSAISRFIVRYSAYINHLIALHLLKPAAILCKTLQYDDVSVVYAIEALLINKQIN